MKWPNLTEHTETIKKIEELTGISFLPEIEIQDVTRGRALKIRGRLGSGRYSEFERMFLGVKYAKVILD